MFGRQRALNYTNPLQGRKWLRFVHDDPVSGLRIEPNLRMPGRVLGFSLSSNFLGLRGPCAVEGEGVVLGTSFAMGFTVDDGQNWYDLSLEPSNWLNLSLPVGMRQLEALLETYYRGAARTALVLYHPNFWGMTHAFERWRARGGSIFDIMGWQTDLWRCLVLYLRKRIRLSQAIRQGRALRFRHEGIKYFIDARYNRFDFEKYPDVVDLTLTVLERMLSRFERVAFIRTLLKQDILPAIYRNDELVATVQSYDRGWNLAISRLKAHPRIEFYIPEGLTLMDYQPWDTHWNLQGNAKIAALVKSILKKRA